MNAFRDAHDQWDAQTFSQWSSLTSFMLHSPNCQKICLEVQQIKKRVLRPHISRIPQHTLDSLAMLRDTLLAGLTERGIVAQYRHSLPVRRLVTLVFISVYHVVPPQEDPAADEMEEPVPQVSVV